MLKTKTNKQENPTRQAKDTFNSLRYWQVCWFVSYILNKRMKKKNIFKVLLILFCADRKENGPDVMKETNY